MGKIKYVMQFTIFSLILAIFLSINANSSYSVVIPQNNIDVTFTSPLDGSSLSQARVDIVIELDANGNTSAVSTGTTVVPFTVSLSHVSTDPVNPFNGQYEGFENIDETITFQTATDTKTVTFPDVPIPFPGNNYYTVIIGSILGIDQIQLHINNTSDFTPVYRFWSNEKYGHVYTASYTERNDIIADTDAGNWDWGYEGIVFFAHTTSNCSQSDRYPVYRFWSDEYQKHFFTINENEMNDINANNPNWQLEGPVYCAYKNQVAGTSPIFRFWSDEYQGHFYTISESEKNDVQNNNPNWTYEGVAYYAIP